MVIIISCKNLSKILTVLKQLLLKGSTDKVEIIYILIEIYSYKENVLIQAKFAHTKLNAYQIVKNTNFIYSLIEKQ